MSSTFKAAENCRKVCHRFWLRLRHAVILISNDQTSGSKNIIELMALIRTLTVSTLRSKERRKILWFSADWFKARLQEISAVQVHPDQIYSGIGSPE